MPLLRRCRRLQQNQNLGSKPWRWWARPIPPLRAFGQTRQPTALKSRAPSSPRKVGVWLDDKDGLCPSLCGSSEKKRICQDVLKGKARHACRGEGRADPDRNMRGSLPQPKPRPEAVGNARRSRLLSSKKSLRRFTEHAKSRRRSEQEPRRTHRLALHASIALPNPHGSLLRGPSCPAVARYWICICPCTVAVRSPSEKGFGRKTEFGMRAWVSERASSA